MLHSIRNTGILTAILALVSCSSDEEITPSQSFPRTVSISFRGELPQTRASIEVDETLGRFSGQWDPDDAITLLANGQPLRFVYNPTSHRFEGKITDNASSWNYRAISPHTELTPRAIPFGAERTQNGNKFNSLYDPLLSKSILSDKPVGNGPDGQPLTLDFVRLSSILALNFTTSVPEIAGERVEQITLRVDNTPIAARSFDIDLTTGNGRLSSEEASSEITLSYLPENRPTAAEAKAYFNIPAGDYLNLRAEITTEHHRALLPLRASVTLKAGELAFATRDITLWETKTIQASLTQVNLWTNNARVLTENFPSGASLHYKRSTRNTWQTATRISDREFEISPHWIEEGNTSRPDTDTGIFAEASYDWQATVGEKIIASGSFGTMANGALIPTLSDPKLSCYTSDNKASAFWGSGNNSMASGLCSYTEPYTLMKAGTAPWVGFLTPGNLFSGTFEFSTTSGTVGFGQKFDYREARPTALKVNCKASIGNINKTRHKKDGKDPLSVGTPDEAVIMVCIVDWAARHQTSSGMSSPTGVWDPSTREGLSPEQIDGLIAYGVAYIHTGENPALEIPLHFYQKTQSAPRGNYTVVISCSTSRYGDFLNGCSTNELSVKDFKWVY